MSQRTLPSWTCTRCLRAIGRQTHRRGYQTISRHNTATAAAYEGPATHSNPSYSQDDSALRRIFDSPTFWKEFSISRAHHLSGQNAGLIKNRYLTKPNGFQQFADVTLKKCRRIVAAVLEYKSVQEYKRIARDLDRLSDLLCRVIDLSDFIRSVHPDPRISASASRAYALMFEYMNVLNTTPGLNTQLKTAASIPEVWNSWSEEERTVAEILIRDFSKSAIDMAESHRQAFIDISNEIAETGTAFVDEMSAEKPYLSFTSSQLKGMDPLMVRRLGMSGWSKINMPMVGLGPTMALRSVVDPAVRKDIYMAHRTSSQDSIHRLERLLKRRAELAKLSGFESYGHMTLAEKMAATPEAVTTFLDAVSKDNAGRVQQETQDLVNMKRQDLHSGSIEAWDRDYYTTKLLSTLRSKSKTHDFLSAYFSLGTVMQGISRLYHRLYGIRFVPREALPGETWNSDVRRLDVIDDNDGCIAVIYCDLFEREGKSPNPAHFTLRCSRKISEEEIEEAANETLFDSPEQAANDGLETARYKNDDNALYQLPTIALICDFATNFNQQRPALLTFREVRTLFHEMGHALHSICGRTQLQNVAGTRCATDFAELPSVLNESFASAPEVLALWARHWETDEPLDPSRVLDKVNIERRTEGTEVEAQIMMGMLDQRYHSAIPLSWQGTGNPSTQVYQDVWRQYSSIAEPDTSWQGFFGHLFGYGATYYSYLFDRAIAGKIWRDVFQRTSTGALDPEAGHRYRQEVLRWGGGRDAWRCVGGLLGGEEGEIISNGGKKAMQRVGSWGVHDTTG